MSHSEAQNITLPRLSFVREWRNQKRSNYVIPESSPSDLSQSDPPPSKRPRTALGERDINVNGGNWGGTRARAGRKKRTANDTRALNTTLGNTA